MSKRCWIGFAFALLLTLPAGCDLFGDENRAARPEGPLLPLSAGNEWGFTREESANRGTTRVLGTTVFQGRTYHVTNGGILPETLRTDDHGRVYRVQQGTEGLWVDPTVADSGTYNIDPLRFEDEINVRRVTVERDVTVETLVGTFGNGVQYRFNYRGIADDTVWITFVPGVGPVRRQNSWVGPALLASVDLRSP